MVLIFKAIAAGVETSAIVIVAVLMILLMLSVALWIYFWIVVYSYYHQLVHGPKTNMPV